MDREERERREREGEKERERERNKEEIWEIMGDVINRRSVPNFEENLRLKARQQI